jgi:hypothetical protein
MDKAIEFGGYSILDYLIAISAVFAISAISAISVMVTLSFCYSQIVSKFPIFK